MKILRADDEVVRRDSKGKKVGVRCLKDYSSMRTNTLNAMSARPSIVLFCRPKQTCYRRGHAAFLQLFNSGLLSISQSRYESKPFMNYLWLWLSSLEAKKICAYTYTAWIIMLKPFERHLFTSFYMQKQTTKTTIWEPI